MIWLMEQAERVGAWLRRRSLNLRMALCKWLKKIWREVLCRRSHRAWMVISAYNRRRRRSAGWEFWEKSAVQWRRPDRAPEQREHPERWQSRGGGLRGGEGRGAVIQDDASRVPPSASHLAQRCSRTVARCQSFTGRWRPRRWSAKDAVWVGHLLFRM